MPKLIKVSVEKQEDGKTIYTYKRASIKTGHETIIKHVYQQVKGDRLSFTIDLLQRMKAENNGYKNKTVFWNGSSRPIGWMACSHTAAMLRASLSAYYSMM